VSSRSRAARAPEPPRFDENPAQPPPGADGLEPGATVDAVRIAGARLVDPDLAGARLRGLGLTDVLVERGNLANLAAPELSLRRVVITGARLTGAQWTRGTIGDVTFRDCRIDLATFAGTSFERTAFEDCLLTQADFQEALLRSVRFDRCDLTEADLSAVRLDGCELRGCTLDGLTAVDRLRGAAMPMADIVGHAGLFAAALGVRVLDDDREP
jgi:uncharacterized protein YjbI with pentapeptide repeats